MKSRLGLAQVVLLPLLLSCHDDLASVPMPCNDRHGCPPGQMCSGGRCQLVDAAAFETSTDLPAPDLGPRDMAGDAPKDAPVDLMDWGVGDLSPMDTAAPDQALDDIKVQDIPATDLGPPDVSLDLPAFDTSWVDVLKPDMPQVKPDLPPSTPDLPGGDLPSSSDTSVPDAPIIDGASQDSFLAP